MNLIKKEYNGNIVTFDMTSDVMINLTDMAKANGKEVYRWLELTSTKSYLQRLSDLGKEEVKIVKGNHADGRTQGTWGSRRVAVRLAQWLSDDFSIWVDEQIEQLVTIGNVSVQLPKTLPEALRAYADEVETHERIKIELALKQEAIVEGSIDNRSDNDKDSLKLIEVPDNLVDSIAEMHLQRDCFLLRNKEQTNKSDKLTYNNTSHQATGIIEEDSRASPYDRYKLKDPFKNRLNEVLDSLSESNLKYRKKRKLEKELKTKTYILSFGDRIKIGKSMNPEKRIATIRTQSGCEIKDYLILDINIEDRMHEYFDKYRSLGEYFVGVPFDYVVEVGKDMVDKFKEEFEQIRRELFGDN